MVESCVTVGNRESFSIIHVVRRAEGGMQRYVTALLSGLGEQFSQKVAAPPGFLDSFPELQLNHIELIPIDIGDHVGPGTLLKAAALARKLRACRTDIVNSHGYKAALPAAIAARLAGAKSIITAHNIFPSNASPAARAALRFAARLSDRVVAVSPALAESVAAAGVDARKIMVVPPGIDLSVYNDGDATAQFRLLRQAQDGGLCGTQDGGTDVDTPGPVILCVARLTRVKGVEYLIRASADLAARYPDARVLIAGDGPDAESLRALAEDVAPQTIRFLGYSDDVPGLLRMADIVVVPSLEEGLGLFAVEAMASGKPVVASRVGGLAGLVVHERTGLLVPPADLDALSDAITCLLDSPEQAKKMGEAGRSVAEAEYTIQKMINRTEEVYRCAVS